MKKKIIYISIGALVLIGIILGCVFLLGDKETTIDYIEVGKYKLKMGTYAGVESEYNPDTDSYDEETITIFIDDKNVKINDTNYTYSIKDNTITADSIVINVTSNTTFIYEVGSGIEFTLVKGYSITKSNSKEKDNGLSGYKVTKAESSSIEYETFDNGLVSMQIPKGWNVTIYPDCDAIHYTFIVTNPENTNYSLFFNMYVDGFLSTEAERTWYASLYPDAVFATLPAMDPMTTERVFQVFNQFSIDSGDFINPKMNNFTKIDSLGTTALGGEVIRGTFTNDSGEKVEGIFTTTLKKYSLYYVNTVALYQTSFYTVPDGELINWEPILNNCLESITFSDTLLETIQTQQSIITESINDVARITSETTDIINSGWEERSATYDIMSQKQSDATLGYERVYDTETGDIYKAYNGFTDDYYGDRYQTISDDMYLDPITGYINK